MKQNKTIFAFFGITGDLAKRYLIPAIWCISKDKDFFEEFEVIGIGRKDKNKEEFEKDIKNSLSEFANCKENNISKSFLNKFQYLKVEDYNNQESYEKLKEIIDNSSKNFKTQVIYYLAMPPKIFIPILENIKKTGLNEQNNVQKKIVFEKPFGEDLKSAKKLNESIMKVFKEEDVYRIDHYLGKEAVQNFMALRFSNYIFEPLWNNRHIDNIQVTASESLGVEDRGSYYDNSGALRDMVQNHLFQMLSLIAMEPPAKLDAKCIRDEKIKVLNAIKSFDKWESSVVFGQYDEGTINGKKLKAYLEEPGVAKNSRTETYTALKVEIDNWRWAGVPFYLRTGKRLKERGTSVVVEFKKTPRILFNENSKLETNKLILKIQPDESIKLQLNIKSPKSDKEISTIETEFDHKHFFQTRSPQAYEKLLFNIVKSDQTHFSRWDAVETSWKIVDKLVTCRDNCPMIFKYPVGSYGPQQADNMLKKDGRVWHNI